MSNSCITHRLINAQTHSFWILSIVLISHFRVQYNLSNPASYQTEKKFRIRQGAGIERLTYPRDIKVALVSIGIQHTADDRYVNELYIVHTNLFQVKTFEVIISYPQIKPLKIKISVFVVYTNVSPSCLYIYA